MRSLLSEQQLKAAAVYWTKVLTGELKISGIDKYKVSPMHSEKNASKRQQALKSLANTNPHWALDFMLTLHRLINAAEKNGQQIDLRLFYGAEGLLKQAAEENQIPDIVFPVGKASLGFTTDGRISDNNTKYDAQKLAAEFDAAVEQISRELKTAQIAKSFK